MAQVRMRYLESGDNPAMLNLWDGGVASCSGAYALESSVPTTMTTAMVLDSFAAPDIDMHMNVSTTDFESWETSMDADADEDQLQSSAGDSVEIDMDAHDEQDLETYDMAEVQETYLDEDVEFHDVSPNQPAQQEFSEDSLVVDLTESHEDAPLDFQLMDSSIGHPATEIEVQGETEPVEAFDPWDPATAISEEPPSLDIPDAAPPQMTHTENAQVNAEIERSLESGAVESLVPHEGEAFPEDPTPVLPSEQVSAEEGYTDSAEPLIDTTSQVDPHELEDGISIDPPPALLLSLPSGIPDVYLFSNPAHSSSGSPTPGSSHSEQHNVSVLLAHAPVMYYSPLSSFFEELRNEATIAQLSGLHDSEMVLQAIDLNLSVSEVRFVAQFHSLD